MIHEFLNVMKISNFTEERKNKESLGRRGDLEGVVVWRVLMLPLSFQARIEEFVASGREEERLPPMDTFERR